MTRTTLTAAALGLAFLAIQQGCAAKTGKLSFVQPIAPVSKEGTPGATAADTVRAAMQALFARENIGFQEGTGDSAVRMLGRLRSGYTADTLNVLICGDNRPSYRTAELRTYTTALRDMVSLNPLKWVNGLVHVPVVLYRGTFPDAKLWRDIPALIRRSPDYGREEQVVEAMVSMVDSLEGRGQVVSCAINSGDLIKDGRYPGQWERFLKIVDPLSSRVPYFAIAGNHERTDTKLGLENWRTATGLPIDSDRLYYCFDSADGWVRFIALDSNPMTDPKNYWDRETEVAYSKEQIDWMAARLDEHPGPAIVFLHHPPFALGFHRLEWEFDDMLKARRAEMVRVLMDHQLSIMVAGHEHAYSRALLRCGDDVLIVVTSGGGGSPLHDIPVGEDALTIFAAYDIPGCGFTKEDVFASRIFHFMLARYWFGGGEFYTYAVGPDAEITEVDHVTVDLSRYGVPKIDQEKIPIYEQKGPRLPPPPEEEGEKEPASAPPDSTGPSDRIKEGEGPATTRGAPAPGRPPDEAPPRR